ncbi:hypothetical protein PCL_03674 [Purpureocillium lilacinum]|uniref:Uncharacterized protein n=1 Tax=Purpureocillium lilacinum TaxID=33203 RepID=A0A2U3EPS9_PURLI|nr:hypothetical protein Purlil1_2354 [Purpureocillium lilacinum]PWI76480.1 hypothetical protein PCL_03674 [Purpureocillium lilacinum]
MVDHEHQHSSTSNLHAVRLDHFGREAEQVPSPPAVVLPYGWMLLDFNTYSRVPTERETHTEESVPEKTQAGNRGCCAARALAARRTTADGGSQGQADSTYWALGNGSTAREYAADQRQCVCFLPSALVVTAVNPQSTHRGG